MEQEAWLSGALENVSPLLMPAAHALLQAARDIKRAASDLSAEGLCAKPNGAPSVGFHLRHIAGSIDRLLTYARGEKLSDEQFAELDAESEIDDSTNAGELVGKTIRRIEDAIEEISLTPEKTLFENRVVGRLELPTNVFGLLFHVAEHTQRHVGQIVATATIVRGIDV
jgi:uncharacterized damage-inducible protein DinB